MSTSGSSDDENGREKLARESISNQSVNGFLITDDDPEENDAPESAQPDSAQPQLQLLERIGSAIKNLFSRNSQENQIPLPNTQNNDENKMIYGTGPITEEDMIDGNFLISPEPVEIKTIVYTMRNSEENFRYSRSGNARDGSMVNRIQRLSEDSDNLQMTYKNDRASLFTNNEVKNDETEEEPRRLSADTALDIEVKMIPGGARNAGNEEGESYNGEVCWEKERKPKKNWRFKMTSVKIIIMFISALILFAIPFVCVFILFMIKTAF